MNEFWRAIIDPWTWSSMQATPGLETFWPIIVQGMLVSVALGLVGCFLVVRGTSLLGDALSHSVLPGIVIGFLIGGRLSSPWILIGATAVGILAALLVQTLHSNSRVKEDASLGIVFTTMFAIGVVMISVHPRLQNADLDPGCVLYGNIEYFVINRGGIVPMACILAGIVAGLCFFYRQLLVSTFDPELAISLGIRAAVVHFVLMAVLSLTVVASFEAVGAILAVALLIMPGATARLWTDRMPSMLIVAALHGVISTLLGYWMSHEAVANTSASGAICVAGFGLFIGSWLLAPRQGLVMQGLVRRKLNRAIASENLIKTIGEMTSDRSPLKLSLLRNELGMPGRSFEAALRRAIAAGWIERNTPETLALTGRGRAAAERLAKAHVLWETYLHTQVGVAPDHVHDAAEWIEHHLDPDNVRELDELLTPHRADGR